MPRQGRVPPEDLRFNTPIEPAARPVDTFVAPQAPAYRNAPAATNSLIQLGESLAKINPALQNLTASLKPAPLSEMEKAQYQSVAGELALKNQSDWNSAQASLRKRLQDTSLLPEQRQDIQAQLDRFQGSNPWVRHFYNQAQVGNITSAFDQAVRTEWSTSEIRNTDDINAFDAWFDERAIAAQQTSKAYGDIALGESFYPNIIKTKSALLTEHINYRQKQRVEAAQESFSVGALDAVSRFNQGYTNKLPQLLGDLQKNTTLSAEEKVRQINTTRSGLFELYGQELTQLSAKAKAMGLDGKELNIRLTDSIIAKAEELGDTNILNLAKNVKTGTGVLADIPDMKDRLTQARRRIASEQWTTEQRRYAAEEQHRKESLRENQSKALGILMANPNADITTIQTDLINQGSAVEAIQLGEVKRKMQENAQNPVEDKSVADATLIDAFTGNLDVDDLVKVAPKVSKGTISAAAKAIAIRKDHENSDAGGAAMSRKAVTDFSNQMVATYKLSFGIGTQKEKREAEVRATISQQVAEYQERYKKQNGGVYPTSLEVLEYARTKIQPSLEAKYRPATSPNRSESSQKPAQVSQQPPQKKAPPKPVSTDPRIQKIRNDPRISPERKRQLIQFLGG